MIKEYRYFIIFFVVIFIAIASLNYFNKQEPINYFMVTEFDPEGKIINSIYTNNFQFQDGTIIVTENESNDKFYLKGTCQIIKVK